MGKNKKLLLFLALNSLATSFAGVTTGKIETKYDKLYTNMTKNMETDILLAEKQSLEELLSSEATLKRLLIKEITADAKQYGDARRTLIEQAQKSTVEVK